MYFYLLMNKDFIIIIYLLRNKRTVPYLIILVALNMLIALWAMNSLGVPIITFSFCCGVLGVF